MIPSTKIIVTNDMLQAAVEKAVEAGLLPKYARKAESVVEREMMKMVLQAAIDAWSVHGDSDALLKGDQEHRRPIP